MLDVVLVVAEVDRALGLPGDRLGLLELLFAAEGLDRLVEDGVRVLVVGLGRAGPGSSGGWWRRPRRVSVSWDRLEGKGTAGCGTPAWHPASDRAAAIAAA